MNSNEVCFCLLQFLGRWYTIATYSNTAVEFGSGVVLLTGSDTNDVINLLFTGSVYSLALLTSYYIALPAIQCTAIRRRRSLKAIMPPIATDITLP